MIKITSLFEQINTDSFWSKDNLKLLLSLPGSGVSTVLKEIPQSDNNTIYIYSDCIEAGERNEMNGLRHIVNDLYTSLVSNQLVKKGDIDQITNNYRSILNFFKELSLERKVVLILDNFDSFDDFSKYFFDTIKIIVSSKEQKQKNLKLLISAEKYFDEFEYVDKFGQLFPLLYENIEIVNGFQVDEIEEVLSSITPRSLDWAKKIYQITAGNPKLVDKILDIISEGHLKEKSFNFDHNILLENKTIYFTIFHIWKNLSEKQRETIGSNSVYDNSLSMKFLIDTGLLLKLKNDVLAINCELLNVFQTNIGTKSIDAKQIKEKSSKRINTDKLSSQEYQIFEYLRKKENKVVTKQSIANIIWKDIKRGKKTDWAIDQLMKRLRQKIGDKDGMMIQTIRGRGYRFSR